MPTKICSKCKQVLPLSEFYKDRSSKDGYCYGCKECRRPKECNRNKLVAYKRDYYQRNKEKRLQYQKQYRKRNKEKITEYYLNNIAKQRLYYLENRDKAKAYYLRNRDKILAYWKRNKDRNKDRKKNYYSSDNGMARALHKANPMICVKDIPPEAIKLRQTILLIHRELRKGVS